MVVEIEMKRIRLPTYTEALLDDESQQWSKTIKLPSYINMMGDDVQRVLQAHIDRHTHQDLGLDPHRSWYKKLHGMATPPLAHQIISPLVAVTVITRQPHTKPSQILDVHNLGARGWCWSTPLSPTPESSCGEPTVEVGAVYLLCGTLELSWPANIEELIARGCCASNVKLLDCVVENVELGAFAILAWEAREPPVACEKWAVSKGRRYADLLEDSG